MPFCGWSWDTQAALPKGGQGVDMLITQGSWETRQALNERTPFEINREKLGVSEAGAGQPEIWYLQSVPLNGGKQTLLMGV